MEMQSSRTRQSMLIKFKFYACFFANFQLYFVLEDDDDKFQGFTTKEPRGREYGERLFYMKAKNQLSLFYKNILR